ncbi:hypothetical protein EEL50_08085 [Muribaculaceae bacterium Isolate-105 (HZI)]|uniref:Mor transcription activator family protein n=2 Tax=Bacteroidia TaxID=200643 RepID=UPI000F46640C|nr:Mor transcription activator family protein [Bacteroides caecimuris]ROT14431.1 hypothetical protein EEL50_08085 [Muribaculaceae bacterium Isolate-105 (HZI)]
MTNYELLIMNRSMVEVLLANHININDVQNLQIYEQFMEMKKQGHKVTYITVFLAHKYGMTDRGIYKIVKRLSRSVSVNQQPPQAESQMP